jgi:hypothetical protein
MAGSGGAVWRPHIRQDKDQYFAPTLTLIIFVLGFCGFCCFGAASISSAFKASINALDVNGGWVALIGVALAFSGLVVLAVVGSSFSADGSG